MNHPHVVVQPSAPVFIARPPTYPQGVIRNPVLQAIAARRPIGVGGIADALGTATGVLEIAGTIAVCIIGWEALMRLTGHRR